MASSSSDQIILDHIQKRWKLTEFPEAWRNLPEIPNKNEICPRVDALVEARVEPEQWDDYQRDPIYNPTLPENTIQGPWPSKADYIGAHYQILREDAIAPLRKAVAEYKRRPNMMEAGDTHIYTHVTFRGLQLSPIGAAFRVEFSHERAGKQIRWEQSKRLIQGSIVALTPQSDNFHNVCKIAVIAARPIIGGLDQNPPQVDIFWGDDKDAVFDPSEEYVMVEARSSYFEAYRHMLEAMQKLMTENFSLANHIVDLDPDLHAPIYVEDQPILDLSPLVPPEQAAKPTEDGSTLEESLQNVDILQNFPAIPESGMDSSQTNALRSMLSRKVAIIQGPPGTGKTFVSVAALKVMLANMEPGDPPIVVSAQTNHALDQLLNHILAFEPNVLRLGGRSSKENEEILKRTLYELRQNTRGVPGAHHHIRLARSALDLRTEEICRILSPLANQDILDTATLLHHGIITQSQYDSLGGDDWDGEDSGNVGFKSWLRPDQFDAIPRTPPVNTDLPMEEGDIEKEQLRELEMEAQTNIHEEKESNREALTGKWLGFIRTVNGRGSGIDDRDIKKLLSASNSLHSIPAPKRGDVYRYLVKKLDNKMRRELRARLVKYREAVDSYHFAKWVANIKLIKHVGIKLIGCTTTGLSKYRGLLASVQPRVILIEEAAETLEGTIIAGMLDSLQHLILVGDHLQLQASCNVKALEDHPYHMNVSMFERLVQNSISYVMLNRQRRMVPEIRGLLCVAPSPFYNNLTDHPSVLDRTTNRPPIPGMGDRTTYFFHHNWPEARNSDSSRYNLDEARMVVGLFNHLVLNGVDPSKITVLTFYNGQRKTILRELKNHNALRGTTYFNCFTVDSYQGEENDIILLSLVRSNRHLGIGFLESKNRLVVALSRARRGLYLFGNALTLAAAEGSEDTFGRDPLWEPIIQHMRCQNRFNLDSGLPVTCSTHNRTLVVDVPDDWIHLAGGCNERCGDNLTCGHPCPYACHPFEHSQVACQHTCLQILACGHGCSGTCSAPCSCSKCEMDADDLPPELEELSVSQENSPTRRSVRQNGLTLPSANLSTLSFAATVRMAPPTSLDVRNSPDFISKRSPQNKFRFNDPQGGLHNPRAGQRSTIATLPRQNLGPAAWKNWDAQKSDAEYLARRRAEEDQGQKTDSSKVAFSESYQKVTVSQNGNRVKAPRGPIRRVVEGVEVATNVAIGNAIDSSTRIATRNVIGTSKGTDARNTTEPATGLSKLNLNGEEEKDLLSFNEPAELQIPTIASPQSSTLLANDFDTFESKFHKS
ncbi:p-loop containing nucleoside triphosphate hydrolase [Venustampulla echinocandica]|uniref:p-loop containing nucleoside triphosphate hydrolase n=1 Tax=Venustampulla echinocandica TaxID=2656787 RepID=A0A370U1K8_9HELO|nr:p-loop containing nucleoside triphosphate hydrolase [Venustampulla echinocandica]RDL41661.1 p-loop containing nucleoside triphosphate hydrolase [Venustampulla echinocandica]